MSSDSIQPPKSPVKKRSSLRGVFSYNQKVETDNDMEKTDVDIVNTCLSMEVPGIIVTPSMDSPVKSCPPTPKPRPRRSFDGLIIGSFEYPDGSYYEGEWSPVTGQKHGYGTYKFGSGSCYDGRLENDLPSGLGRLDLSDGSIYAGEFMEGWFHGHGVYVLPNGTKYEGQFRAGKIWGLGLTTFSDGSNGYPRHEGWHQDFLFKKKQRCWDVIERARDIAMFTGLIITDNNNVHAS